MKQCESASEHSQNDRDKTQQDKKEKETADTRLPSVGL